MGFAALYIRVSTKGKQVTGLEAQKRALEEYCKVNKIEDYVVYSDEGVSGAKASRPALDRLMRDVNNYKVSKVLVYSFSRFARSTQHLLAALDQFKRLHVEFISLTEKIETNSAVGVAFITVIGCIAQLERELISERVKCGLDNARAKKKQIGRKRTSNEKLIIELREQGMSYRKIAELAGCSPSTVSRVLARSEKAKS